MLKKKMWRYILFLFVIIEIIFIASNLLTLNNKKTYIISQLEQSLGGNVKIKGKIRIQFKPYPVLVLEHFRYNNLPFSNSLINIRAPKAATSISLVSLITGNYKISTVSIYDSKLKIILTTPKKGKTYKSSTITSLKEINVINSDYIIKSEDGSFSKSFKKLNLNIKSSKKNEVQNQLIANGDFRGFNSRFVFDSNITIDKENNILASQSNIESQYAKFYFDSLTTTDGASKGEFSIISPNIQKTIFYHIFMNKLIFPDTDKSPINLNASYTYKNKKLGITNGKIAGKTIDGNFTVNQAKAKKYIIDLIIDKLHTDELISKRKSSYIKQEMKHLKVDPIMNISLPKELDIKLSVTIKEMLYKKSRFQNIKSILRFSGKSGISINELKFNLAENNEFTINGKFQKKEDKEKEYFFEGNLQSKGKKLESLINSFGPQIPKFANRNVLKEYILNSKFIISKNLLQISNLELNFDDSTLNAEMKYYHSEKKSSELEFSIRNSDLSKYETTNASNQNVQIIENLYNNITKDAEKRTLLHKLIWLRTIPKDIKLKIKIEESKYNDEAIDKLTLDAIISHRKLNIQKVSLISNKNDFTGNFSIDISKNIPIITTNITGDKINLLFLKNTNKITKNGWSENLYKIPNLRSFEIKFSLNSKKVTYRNLKFNDVSILIKFQNQYFNIERFSGIINNSKTKDSAFDLQGNLSLEGLPSFNIAYKIINLPFNTLSNLILPQNFITAIINISGTATSYGSSPSMMITQLKSQNKFKSSAISINNMNLRGLTQGIADLATKPEIALKKPLKEIITNGSTNYKFFSGNLNFDNGVGILNEMKLESRNLKTNITGKIDLNKKYLNINAITAFKGFYLKGKKITSINLNLPYSIAGNFDKHRSEYNLLQIENFIEELRKKYLKKTKTKTK
jgi:hypothetical protein